MDSLCCAFRNVYHFIFDLIDFLPQLLPSIIPYSFSCSHLPPAPLTTKGLLRFPFIDVLTYNVEFTAHYESSRRQKILSAIASSNADIVCLQETNQKWQDVITSALGKTYPYCHFFHPRGRSAGGSAFLSRFPLRDVTLRDYTEGDGKVEGSVFPTLVATFEVSSTGSQNPTMAPMNVTVANVHLRPPVNLDGSATLSTSRLTGSVREAEMKRILEDNRAVGYDGVPFDLIVGDFNEGDGAHASRYAKIKAGYKDALEEFVPWWKETHRWPFFVKGMTMHKRLDHILYHGGLRCLGCGVLTGYEKGGSDHQPVLARFLLS